jgi:hypothetical protein
MITPCGLDGVNCHFLLANEDQEAMSVVGKLAEE